MLRVEIALTVGRFLYDSQTVGLRLRRCRMPALDRLEAFLAPGTRFDAAPGDAVALSLDGGEGAETVFTGNLAAVGRGLDGIRIEAQGRGLALARYRPAVALERVSAGDAVRRLCRDGEVDVGAVAEGPSLALYVADGRATALQEIARLAQLAGAAGAFDGRGRLHVTAEGGPGGELALRYGREVVAAHTAERLADPTRLSVIGEGAGEAGSPRGRWVIADFGRSGSDEAGVAVRRLARPEVRSSDDARAAAAALAEARALRDRPVRLRTWLMPTLAPGMLLKLSDMPDAVPLTEVRVLQVLATVSAAHGAWSDVWGSGHAAAGGLLGAVLAAAGGLR
jgi:hypothetical protein